jgi:hypothetical protein
MKKLSTLAPLLACLFVITFYACKKDKDLTRKSGEVAASDETSSSSNFYSSGISVNSTYGFLVFDSINTFDNFCSFATTSTHAEVQAYLDSLGFVSMGHTLFTGTILEDTVT